MTARYSFRTMALLVSVISALNFMFGQTVEVSPSATNTSVNSTFTVQVNVSGVSDLLGSHVVVSFVPTVLQYSNVVNGVVFPAEEPFVDVGSGTVTVDQAALGTDYGGNGTLFSISFIALHATATPTDLGLSVTLRDPLNAPIEATSVGGTVNADKALTTTTLHFAPSPSTHGDPVYLSAQVTPSIVSGSVEFFDGDVSLGTGTITVGEAELAVSTLSPGIHSLKAKYLGNSDYNESTSSSYPHTVNPIITATAGLNGSIEPSGTVAVTYGADQAFTISPAANYHVADVKVDLVSQGPITNYTFPGVVLNHTIDATFAINTHNVLFVAGIGGSISGTTPQTVEHGASCLEVTAIPTGTNYFVRWTGTGGFLSTDNPLTVTNITQDMTITANFGRALYVKSDATGLHDGTSWANAWTDLQSALGAAVYGDEIWVAAGTYRPTSVTDRYASFVMKSGVEIYGGFIGTETSISQRNWLQNVTTLSGDIGTQGDNSDNSYHVLYGSSSDATGVIDGFVVRDGHADAPYPAYWPHMHGAGFYNYGGSPTLRNIVIAFNISTHYGGGAVNQNGSPTFINVKFLGNYSPGWGGGIYNYSDNQPCNPTFINCVFSGNVNGGSEGGAVVNYSSNGTFVNVTFTGNTAPSGGGAVYNLYCNPQCYNSIFWGNTSPQIASGSGGGFTVSYSDVQGGYAGSENIDSDPLFINADGADNSVGTLDDDVTLQWASPCIDEASYAAVPSGITTDLGNQARFVDAPNMGPFAGPLPDMGAYELQNHTVTFAAGTGGTLSGFTSQLVSHGGTATSMTAVPDPIYHFVEWTGTDSFHSTDNPLTVSPVLGDMTITANFVWDQFTDIGAALPQVWAGSVAWGDFDNDGDLDILLAGYDIARVYRNDAGVFTDINAGLTGVREGAVAWGDYDNDGDLDILLTGNINPGCISKVYRNNGGVFTDIGASLDAVYISSVAWGDYDIDGDLDILLTGATADGNYLSKVYRNDRSTFTDINANLGLAPAGSASWGDYDNDGDLDILITGNWVSSVYRNDDGTFTDIGAGLLGLAWTSSSWGDYDSDGYLDILHTGYTIDWAHQSKLYHNNGNGTFSEIDAGLTPVSYGSVAWGDYDNDGDLDILLTGAGNGADIARVYQNNSGAFVDIGAPLRGVYRSSVAWGDYDNDGDLDILLTGGSLSGWTGKIYRNNSVTANTPPSAPSNLIAGMNGYDVSFTWEKSSDAQTPQNGLTYNLRVGTFPGASDILGPMANNSGGYRRVPKFGPVNTNANFALSGLTAGHTYYWSVQAIDNAFAGGPFATEASFTRGANTYTIPAAGLYNLDADGDGTTDMTMNFTAVPSGGGTVAVVYSYEAPPPPALAGGFSYNIHVDCSMPHHSFSVTVVADMNDVADFGENSNLVYWNDESDRWVVVPGAYTASNPSFGGHKTFEFTTDHFSWFTFRNPSATPPEMFISTNSTSGVPAAVYPNDAWSLPASLPPDYPGDNNDWGYTENQPITLWVIPEVGTRLGLCEYFLEWDQSILELNYFDFGSTVDPHALFANGYHQWQGVPPGEYILSAHRTDNTDLTTVADDFVAKSFFNLKKPGHTAIEVAGAVWGTYSPDVNDLWLPHSGEFRAYLGDVASPGNPNAVESTGDGKVDFTDLYLWSESYWSGFQGHDRSEYKVKYDIGPTADGQPYTLPVPDYKIEFEDLMIFAQSYRAYAAHELPKIPTPSTNPMQVSLGKPVVVGNETRIPVLLGGSVTDIRGLKLEVNGQFGKFLGAEKGDLLQQYTTPVALFDKCDGTQVRVDLGVMGLEAQGINREGEVVVLRFEGTPHLRLSSAVARNSGNQELMVQKVRGAGESVPTVYSLSQNFPNPFNPTTTIEFELPQSGEVTLEIYDVLGQKVGTLVNEVQEAGFYQVQWDGRDMNKVSVASGVYFYRIHAGEFNSVKKMLLMK